MGDIVRALRLHGGLPGGTAITLNNALKEILNVKMDDAADVTGGGSTRTVGFQITDFAGDDVLAVTVVQFLVSDDVDLIASAANATLDTAAEGAILFGAGSADLKVKTDANGRFSCVLTDFEDETVFLGCEPSSSPIIDCRDRDSVTFS